MKHFDNSSASQCRRLLAFLMVKKMITTLEARHRLDIIHPAGRIYDLRGEGYDIKTHWSEGRNPGGNRHRVAQYVLMSSKKHKG